MKKSDFLKSGNTIGICAPSACFDMQKFNDGIQVIKKMGYKVKIPKDIFAKKRYLAGDDILRANVINQLFADSEIDGIICARGGFGTMRLLRHLNWESIKNNPKIFIGFSDISALLLSILDKTSHIVIHGPTIASLANAHGKTIESFQNTIQGRFGEIKIADGKILTPGQCSGVLKGGNISTISHLLGTEFQPDFQNAVLFLEDIGEAAYKIDRMLSQMKMAGMFSKITGVITGPFEKCDNVEYIEPILLEIFQDYNIPVITGLNAGHGKINLALPMGVDIKMSIENKIAMEKETAKINWV